MPEPRGLWVERLPMLTRAAVWGVIVFVVTGVFDILTFSIIVDLTKARLWALLFADFTSSIVIAVLIWIMIQRRHDRLQRHLKEIMYLNHHIRNALQVIAYAGGREDLVQDNCLRIQSALEKISREEDLSDIEISPNNREDV